MRFLLIALMFFAVSAQAAEKPLPPAAEIESYLNGLSTVSARFEQIAPDGQTSAGHFTLKRPGRMRFEYDPPVQDFIVADGLMVYYYDAKMKQQSSAPIGASLANFFLRKDLSLSGDLTVYDVTRIDAAVEMTLTQTKDPQAGSLTLIFSEAPLALKGWRVIDMQGLVTEIKLSEMEAGIALKNGLFHYADPEKKKSLLNK